jgi:hypothetical protein
LLLFICVVLDQNGVGHVSIVLLKLHHVFVVGTDKAHAVSILQSEGVISVGVMVEFAALCLASNTHVVGENIEDHSRMQ